MSNGKVFAVTGATGVIGFEIAKKILKASKSNIVHLFCRNKGRAEKTMKKLAKDTNNNNIIIDIVDLSLKGEIQKLRKQWKGKLDVLVINHVWCESKKQLSKDGLEMQFAVNVLGYFWLIEYFKDVLHKSSSKSENSRIVNVVSYWAGRVNLNDLEFKKRKYDNVDAYFQSKACERMLTQYYAKVFQKEKVLIDINSSMSGDVDSKCSRDLSCPVPSNPSYAADTPVDLALGTIGKGSSGGYYEDSTKSSLAKFEKDVEGIKKLILICQGY